MTDVKPDLPKWATRFLGWFCAPDLLEEILGDLSQSYFQNVHTHGAKRATRQFYWDVMRFFNFSTIMGNRVIELNKMNFSMFRHYFIITRRLLAKNKVYILVNTIGLGIAIACCLAAYLLIAFNLEFDQFHRSKNLDDVYRVHTDLITKSGQQFEHNSAPMPLAPQAAISSPGIEQYSRYITGRGFVQKGNQGFSENIAFADSAFLEMFEFPLLHGSMHHFEEKHRIFLSYQLAQKMFEGVNPTGESLHLHFENEKQIAVIVGGVMKKIPQNSTFGFDALIRFENYLDIHDLTIDTWSDWRDPNTFVQLTTARSAPQISSQLEAYIPIRNEAKEDIEISAFHLEPFFARSDDRVMSGYVNSPIDDAPLIIFSVLALMILLIACFNLTNTSIALSTKRLKEIGIRKAVGAARGQIIGQFLYETIIIMSLSLITALLFSWLLILPEFTAMFNLDFGMEDLSGTNLVFTLILILVIASLVAGIYPALLNSRLDPVALVNGTIKTKGTNWLTRILTTTQFGLTVIFLIAGVVFFQNIQFQEKIGFGYDKDRIMMVNISEEKTYEILKNEIRSNPKILEIGVGYSHVGQSSWQSPIEIEGQTFDVRVMGIGENYLETIGLGLVKGTTLDLKNDADQDHKALVNRAFIESISLENPLERSIMMEGSKRNIVGIIENHLDNIWRSQESEPCIFILVAPEKYRTMVINTKESDLQATYKSVQDTWQTLFPDRPFEALLQDEVVLASHRELNANMGKIFFFLTILGLIMSIAGIYSLASLNIARRTKEIGIRKILGASRGSIVGIINKEFLLMLLVSGFVGAIGGYFLTEMLLAEIYQQHIAVGVLPVIISASLVFGAGYLTTSRSILRAATANPMDALESN